MLYHREIKWSDNFDMQINKILDNNTNYVFSQHMKYNNDYKHNINFRKINCIIWRIKKRHYKAFEVETDENNNIIKFVIRTPYDYNKFLDVCIVFAPKKDYVKIKTCWTNKHQDKHYSLNKNKYIN